MVKTSKSSLFGTCEFAHTVYDAADLVIATICGHGSLTTIPTTEAGAIAAYEAANPDKHRVTVYTYDSLGRRIEERTDVGSTLEQKRLIFYDSLNRVVRTIGNYVVQGSSQAGKWWWNGTYWQYNTTTATQVSQGTYNDQNSIEDLEYNELGQVRLKRDATGQVTLYAYDDAGRVKKIIQHASDPDYFESGVEFQTLDSTVRISGDSYPEISDNDQDLITKYVYDEAGNIIKKRLNPDTSYEQATVYAYDGRNRVKQEDINPVTDEER